MPRPVASCWFRATTKNLLVAVRTRQTHRWRTIRSNLADQTYVTVAAPDTVAAFTTLSGATIGITDKADTLTVNQVLLAGANIGRATNDNLIQQLTLSTNEDFARINSIKVTRESNSAPLAADSDTTSGGVKIWLDRDLDGSFSPTLDAPAIGTGSFASGIATFALTPINVTSTPLTVFVTVSTPAPHRLTPTSVLRSRFRQTL